jgi:ABC-type uncharacterized transport system substrate-binding protein
MKKRIGLIICMMLVLSFSAVPAKANYSGKKILFIDSYHEGYAWSDGITNGVKSVIDGKNITLKIVRMDTKRHPAEDFKKEVALKVKAVIENFKPDVVIASDDNASKYLIAPFFKEADLPFVFCGVNWDASGYGFPAKNITGMIEVTPVPQLLEQLKPYAKGNRIGFLGPDILTSRKEAENYKKVFGMTVNEYYAKNFDDWKKGFKELQKSVDILLIDSDGGLYSDKASEMKAFVEANTKVPTGASYDFMAPYVLLDFAKVAEEQGSWAAQAALKILDGTSPADIPVAKNKEGKLIINMRIAKELGVDLPFDFIQSANQVIE